MTFFHANIFGKELWNTYDGTCDCFRPKISLIGVRQEKRMSYLQCGLLIVRLLKHFCFHFHVSFMAIIIHLYNDADFSETKHWSTLMS